MWGGCLMFAAGLHVAAATTSSYLIEYSLGANPVMHELAVEKFPVVDGMLEIPDRPGLGVTIDEEFVKRYAIGGR
jgi:L-alanine-DL-glutamate epimerase-like enolase superfamily enzyme